MRYVLIALITTLSLDAVADRRRSGPNEHAIRETKDWIWSETRRKQEPTLAEAHAFYTRELDKTRTNTKPMDKRQFQLRMLREYLPR